MRYARRGDRHVVIKTGCLDDLQREARALSALGASAVEVIDLVSVDSSTAQLITARVLPGDDLRPTARMDDDAATRIVAELISDMRVDQADRPDRTGLLPALPGVLDPLRECRDDRVPGTLVDAALHLGAELATSGEPVVLHGDLQHRNIARSLNGDVSDWKIIDAHGWWGDACFEAVALLVAPESVLLGSEVIDARGMPGEPLVGRMRRRIDIIAEVTGDDRDRLRSWAFVGALIAEARMVSQHDLVHGAPLALAHALAPDIRSY